MEKPVNESNAVLRDQLKRGGWRSSERYKNFLQTRRAGIDFHLGPFANAASPTAAARLELRYVYVTERTNADGSVDLPEGVTAERVGDAMTTIYLRVHERPDPSRTFGGSKRPARAAAAPAAPNDEDAAAQTALDL